MIPDEQIIENLKKLHAKDGGEVAGEASFTCPQCGIRPILFVGNRKWNDGQPVVECLCFAPFSPRPQFEGLDIWSFPMLQNAEAWGLFVQWKHELPEPEDEEEDNE